MSLNIKYNFVNLSTTDKCPNNGKFSISTAYNRELSVVMRNGAKDCLDLSYVTDKSIQKDFSFSIDNFLTTIIKYYYVEVASCINKELQKEVVDNIHSFSVAKPNSYEKTEELVKNKCNLDMHLITFISKDKFSAKVSYQKIDEYYRNDTNILDFQTDEAHKQYDEMLKIYEESSSNSNYSIDDT